ncbi:MAG: hypothetical protein HY904_16985 [Deltaproteobacteria bacterium]|nr:hypothetical protein [Deltaproteobacteria bacterium]
MRSLLPAPAWVHQYVATTLHSLPPGAPLADPSPPCPRCGAPLCLTGYRRTETPYLVEEVLACVHCRGELLLHREERA